MNPYRRLAPLLMFSIIVWASVVLLIVKAVA